MITIKNVKTLKGTTENYSFPSSSEEVIDGKGKLTLFPAVIDCHVHFRTPGAEHKENWISGAKAAIAGGVTTVIDMPNNNPPLVDRSSFAAKKKLIDEQLANADIPPGSLGSEDPKRKGPSLLILRSASWPRYSSDADLTRRSLPSGAVAGDSAGCVL